MRIGDLGLTPRKLPAPLPMWRATVDADAWLSVARTVAADGGRLIALWGTDVARGASPALCVCVALATGDGLLWIDLPLDAPAFEYPDLVPLFPAANRMQRAARDLAGITARGAADRRPWLAHGAWPAAFVPLWRSDAGGPPPAPSPVTDYPFVQVVGDGVHEIPVGPVHAGIIEPGHFRFSVVGEKVLRLEERLGYTHKGIEKRFEDFTVAEGYRLAGRISGDSTVAYAWAYCQAAEALTHTAVPPRARRQPSRRPARARQRRGLRARARALHAPQGRLAAPQPRALRPSLRARR